LPPTGPEGRVTVEIPPKATVATLLRRLGIPDDMPRVVLVNGRDADDDLQLRPDDVVSAFPPLAGGSVQNGTDRGKPPSRRISSQG
jgi:hypothetical protein